MQRFMAVAKILSLQTLYEWQTRAKSETVSHHFRDAIDFELEELRRKARE